MRKQASTKKRGPRKNRNAAGIDVGNAEHHVALPIFFKSNAFRRPPSPTLGGGARFLQAQWFERRNADLQMS
jgi:hypothetical protein